MADISAIKLPNGVTYNVKDNSKSDATNWVNGSATGSVRTVGSAAEDNNYTMGTYAVAEGNSTKASGDYGSHAEGASTVASANGAHAEGLSTTSSNYGSHAEGASTTASGLYSHAEGRETRAYEEASHAEGVATKAYSKYSHAEGMNTEAHGRSQHVFGENNIVDSAQSSTNRATYVEIVGNGTDSSNLHNARTLDWSGNEVLAGKLTVGAVGVNSMDVATVGQLPTVPANIVNTITTTAGTHTTVSSQKGNVSFNVPTKTSHLTNDSGFVTTDTKNTAGSTSSNSKLFLVGATSQADYAQTYSNGNLYYQNGLYSKSISGDYTSYLRQQYNAASFNVGDDDYTGGLNITRNSIEIFGEGPNTGTSIVVDDDQIALRGANDTVGGTYVDVEGTTSAVGNATFTLGNNIASGTKNNKQGKLALYGSTAYSSTIDGGAPTANRTVSLPNKSGTVALTSDLPTVNNATLTIQKNGTTVNSFTANASSNVTANITVPTKTSDLTNDSGYITNAGVTGVKGNSESSYRTGQVNLTAANVGATSTSVLPNDTGEIKTKFRISQKGYTGNGTPTWYYPLVKLPADNSSNYASLIVSGRIGGWTSDNMSSIQALVWNRGNTGIALLDIAGEATAMSSIWGICDIVVYTDSDTTDTVYLKVKSYYTFDLDIEVFQSAASILYDGTYITTTPTGTLNAQASTSTKRVEVVGGKLLVNGTDLSTTAGTGLSKSGTALNHSNSVTAQTTQAVYPIKIDAQGHISAYGSAVTIPTVNNATLTIQKNGSTVKTFTANASSNVTANISVPTKTSDLINDNSVKSVTQSPSTALDGTIAVTTGGENGISVTDYVPVKGVALQSNIPTTAGSNTTGISVSDHSTSTIYGVQSSTTTASKVTLGTALSVTGVSGSTTASKVTVGSHSTDYGVKAAGSGSFTSGAFSGGSGSFSATVTDHVLSFSHSHTAATHGADSHSHTAPTLGSKVPTVSASDVTVPKAATSATSIPNVTAATDVTVPIKNSSSTTVVTGKSHTVTDNGHTHTLS